MKHELHVIYTDRPSLETLFPVLDQADLPELTARIGIKPNLVVAKPSDSGATTDPELVGTVIEYLKARGYRDIRILESSWLGESTRRAFKVCGYEELSRKYGVPLVDLKQDSAVAVQVGDTEVRICREPLDCDYLISMPVLKAHCQTKLTCALKNLKGCIPDSEKRRFHALGLHRPIAALNRALKSHLTIVDGIIGDLTFEEGGTPVRMNRIIVGEDPVLVDTYAAQLLGYSYEEIPYIALAEKLGVGSTDGGQVTVIEYGGQVEGADHYRTNAKLRLARAAGKTVERLVRCIEERDACSACYGSLIHALYRFEEQHGHLPAGVRIMIGQGFRGSAREADVQPSKAHQTMQRTMQDTKQRVTLGIGRCASALEHHVPGCPPTARAILEALERLTGAEPGGV